MRTLAASLAALGLVGAGPLPEGPVAFVGCPVIRDAPEVPCWLAERNGELYYLGLQQDLSAPFHPPQLGHETLVEGVVTGERICGGRVVRDAKVSVLKPPAPRCMKILPAQGFQAPHAERGPGPSTRPPRLRPPPGPLVLPPPPYSDRRFTVSFDFDRDHIELPSAIILRDAAAYALGAKARVRVVGLRSATRLTGGGELVETAGIARSRAEKVAFFLRELGAADVTAEWRDAPDGAGAASRTVTVEIDV